MNILLAGKTRKMLSKTYLENKNIFLTKNIKDAKCYLP